MRIMTALTAVTLLGIAGLAPAGGPGKIDRTIGPEPAYQGEPRYCLLAFGPEAKTRVWLALDPRARRLYVDRNGNGDLTEKGELFQPAGRNLDVRAYEVPEVGGGDGRTKYANLKVEHFGTEAGARGFSIPESFLVSVEVKGKTHYARLKDFGAKPGSAPVIRFDGPLTLALFDPAAQALTRGDKPGPLTVVIGTWDPGRKVFSAIPIDRPPPEVHPVAEVEFPAKEPGAEPLKVKAVLDQRC